MVERTDQLRRDIDVRRRNISRTVDQIENRVSPGRVFARGTYRIRRRLIDLKDDVMGNEQPDYPWEPRRERWVEKSDRGVGETMTETKERVSERMSELGDAASEKMHEAEEAVKEMPQMVRRQTRGNPMAAGLIAFGGGLLIASLLPSTSAERKAARQARPIVEEGMKEARESGREIAAELKESAKESMDEVKGEARESGERLREETTEAARASSEQARH